MLRRGSIGRTSTGHSSRRRRVREEVQVGHRWLPQGTRRRRIRVGRGRRAGWGSSTPTGAGVSDRYPYSTQPLRNSQHLFVPSGKYICNVRRLPATSARRRPTGVIAPWPSGRCRPGGSPGGARRWIAADDPHPRAGSGCDGFAEPGESGFDRLPEPVAIVDAGGWCDVRLAAVLGGDEWPSGRGWLAQRPVGSTPRHTMEFWFQP